ncbi:MAG: SWF/SNF helicase family protein [Vallitaleaceae bacterium]|nr:SWF/SNF helicase family protein [Vallitaleaceae bacterium]
MVLGQNSTRIQPCFLNYAILILKPCSKKPSKKKCRAFLRIQIKRAIVCLLMKISSDCLGCDGTLDGSIKAGSRKDLVKDFNEGDTQVFLISLKAGGTGLNLTSADVVIHFDPWWNPAVEDQDTDRAYRIGQNNTVQVFKLIAQGFIEEKIFKLQQRKKEMIMSIIEPGETIMNKLSETEIKELFRRSCLYQGSTIE